VEKLCQNMNKSLSKNIFGKDVEKVPTRNGYGEGLVEAGQKDENVVVLCADLTDSTRSSYFKEKFPERFVEVGVAEQNMASLAAGMALVGKVPFISSYAAFSPGRNNEQIRTTIAINDVNVKIAGAHAGISVGPDGATHQALEDMALMRVMPNMRVIYPCDAIEARKATVAAAEIQGPVYLRFARANTPLVTTEETPFEFILHKAYSFARNGVGDNHGGLFLNRLGHVASVDNLFDIMAIDFNNMPVKCLVLFLQRLQRHDVFRVAVDLDIVAIYDAGQIAQAIFSCK